MNITNIDSPKNQKAHFPTKKERILNKKRESPATETSKKIVVVNENKKCKVSFTEETLKKEKKLKARIKKDPKRKTLNQNVLVLTKKNLLNEDAIQKLKEERREYLNQIVDQIKSEKENKQKICELEGENSIAKKLIEELLWQRNIENRVLREKQQEIYQLQLALNQCKQEIEENKKIIKVFTEITEMQKKLNTQTNPPTTDLN